MIKRSDRTPEWHVQRCGRWEVAFRLIVFGSLAWNVYKVLVFVDMSITALVITLLALGMASGAEACGEEWDRIQREEAR